MAKAVVIASALHAIGIQQGFEINPYQFLDYLKTLGVAPIAGDAISAIMQTVREIVLALFRSTVVVARKP